MKKRFLSIALALVMCLSLVPVAALAANYSDTELARAVELGFGAYRSDNPTVTYAQFMTMLDKAVELADSAKLTAWKATMNKARTSDRAVLRCEAAVAVYLVDETLGEDYVYQNSMYYSAAVAPTNPDDPVFDMKMGAGNYDLFDFNPQDDKIKTKYANNFYVAEAYYVVFSQLSVVTGRVVLETNGKSARLDEKLTYTEALLAALRLYESGLDISERLLTAEDKQIINNAETRKKAILASPTAITVKGTKYYVSNKGNDKNDGKAPDKAWASIAKVNSTALQPGDGVFFERGGVWRSVFLWGQEGVTYSAYGEGAKPQLLGSPENGANPGYWELVPGTKNVWQYHIKMNEVGLILVDGDKNLTDKYIAYWDIKQQKYVVSLDLKTPFSLSVLENHQFFSDVDLKGLDGGQIALNGEAAQEAARNGDVKNAQGGNGFVTLNIIRDGNLYFRCDEGNPGNVYKSIEFAMRTYAYENLSGEKDETGQILVHAAGNESVTLDNLSLKYSTVGVFLGKGGTVQNCEFAFLGGDAVGYISPEEASQKPRILRDLVWTDDGVAILFSTSDVTVKDNYIHHIVDVPYNVEQMIDGVYKNIRISGNLFEKCGAGGAFRNFFPNDDPKTVRFQDIYINDNYWMYTGYFPDKMYYDFMRRIQDLDFFHPTQIKNLNYTNNVFYLARGPMFTTALSNGKTVFDAINFSGNTYAQTNGGIILRDDSKDSGFRRLLFDQNAEQTIKQLTGDTTANVLPLSDPLATAPTTAPPSAPDLNGVSSWAVDSVKEAVTLGLATADLTNGYQAATTRAEFCRAAVNFLRKYGYDVDSVTPKLFADTSDKDIGIAAALGITSGTDTAKNLFSPDGTLTREQAATMLRNVMNVIGTDTTPPTGVLWTDAKDISSWAQTAADVMYAAKVMGGTSTTELVFSPKTPYTHEQSIITLVNLWEYVKTVGSVSNTPPVSPSPAPNVSTAAVDKSFNSEAKGFIANSDKTITWTRKSLNGIEYIEAYRDDGTKKPLMFVLHGGGGHKEQCMGELDMYAHEGFYAVALDVAAHGDSDKGPMVNLDAWVETVGYIDTLIDYYATDAKTDSSRFAVGGGSMGGAITFLYGVIGKHTPSLLMPEIGAADYTQIMNGRCNGITDHGRSAGEARVTSELEARAKELSAVNNVDKFVKIPMWARFGGTDIENGVEGTRTFIKLLKDKGGTIQELKVIEGYGHGGFPNETGAGMMEYIKKHMGI